MAYRYTNLSLKLSAVTKKNQLKAQKYADPRQNAAIDGQYNDVQDRIADEDIAVPKPWTSKYRNKMLVIQAGVGDGDLLGFFYGCHQTLSLVPCLHR